METDTLNVEITNETALSYQFKDSETGEVVWFPKSQVSFKRRNVKTGMATAEIPLWLLTNHGWNK